MRASPSAEVLRRARNEPHRAVSPAGYRIHPGRRLLGFGRAREIPRLRNAPDRLGEGGMLGDVGDALAVKKHRAAVVEAREIVVAAPHGGANLATPVG